MLIMAATRKRKLPRNSYEEWLDEGRKAYKIARRSHRRRSAMPEHVAIISHVDQTASYSSLSESADDESTKTMSPARKLPGSGTQHVHGSKCIFVGKLVNPMTSSVAGNSTPEMPQRQNVGNSKRDDASIVFDDVDRSDSKRTRAHFSDDDTRSHKQIDENRSRPVKYQKIATAHDIIERAAFTPITLRAVNLPVMQRNSVMVTPDALNDETELSSIVHQNRLNAIPREEDFQSDTSVVIPRPCPKRSALPSSESTNTQSSLISMPRLFHHEMYGCQDDSCLFDMEKIHLDDFGPVEETSRSEDIFDLIFGQHDPSDEDALSWKEIIADWTIALAGLLFYSFFAIAWIKSWDSPQQPTPIEQDAAPYVVGVVKSLSLISFFFMGQVA